VSGILQRNTLGKDLLVEQGTTPTLMLGKETSPTNTPEVETTQETMSGKEPQLTRQPSQELE
jgi:hypothetical protein